LIYIKSKHSPVLLPHPVLLRNQYSVVLWGPRSGPYRLHALVYTSASYRETSFNSDYRKVARQARANWTRFSFDNPHQGCAKTGLQAAYILQWFIFNFTFMFSVYLMMLSQQQRLYSTDWENG